MSTVMKPARNQQPAWPGCHRPTCDAEETGETSQRRTPDVGRDDELTAQEALIGRMARDGLSNPEIGTRLSSARTPSTTTCARSSPSSA